MKKELFNYNLPDFLIAQKPVSPRHNSRMMVVDRSTNKISHHIFWEIDKFLEKNDLLVLNNTKVFPARLLGQKETGGKTEVLLCYEDEAAQWKVLSKKLKAGSKISFDKELWAEVIGREENFWVLKFNKKGKEFWETIFKIGQTPLPPYIKSQVSPDQYQSIFAQKIGSVAAPTASFHFTKEVFEKLRRKGVEIVYITLHVGPATFLPIKSEEIENHQVLPEVLEINQKAALQINQAKKENRRVVAVGTTVVRALESAACESGGKFLVKPMKDKTHLFITPGYQFKIIDGLLTNFHLPYSSNLVLVCAFGGYDLIMKAYNIAVAQQYRFYSFGDCMLII